LPTFLSIHLFVSLHQKHLFLNISPYLAFNKLIMLVNSMEFLVWTFFSMEFFSMEFLSMEFFSMDVLVWTLLCTFYYVRFTMYILVWTFTMYLFVWTFTIQFFSSHMLSFIWLHYSLLILQFVVLWFEKFFCELFLQICDYCLAKDWYNVSEHRQNVTLM